MNARIPISQQEIYRAMTPSQRVRAGCSLHDFVHQRLVLEAQRQFPSRSPREIRVTVARRLLGDAAGVL
jgi:hypothetical protein